MEVLDQTAQTVLERAHELLSAQFNVPKRDYKPKDSYATVMFTEGKADGHREVLAALQQLIKGETDVSAKLPTHEANPSKVRGYGTKQRPKKY